MTNPHDGSWAFIHPLWLNRSQPNRKELEMTAPYRCGCPPKFDAATGKDVPFCKAHQEYSDNPLCVLGWKPDSQMMVSNIHLLRGTQRPDGTSVLDYTMPPPNTVIDPVVSPHPSNEEG